MTLNVLQGKFFKNQGYKVIQTPASNDQGADLIIEKKQLKQSFKQKDIPKKS
jgi:HJR/Mrr/RecB family endonuclease